MHGQQHPSDGPADTNSALTRRQVMAVTGLGAAAGALGSLVGAGSAAAATSDSAASATSGAVSAADIPVPRILSGDRYPIGLWWPPHPFETNDARYQQIVDAGFTFIIGGNYLNDTSINKWAMARAETAGLDFIPGDPDLGCLTHMFSAGGPDAPFMLSDTEVHDAVKTILARYPSSSLAGLLLFDEPKWEAKPFATLGKFAAAMRELAPNALPYVNMLARGYIDYYRDFIKAVQPPFLSFDFYPFTANAIDLKWFLFLSNVRTAGLEAGIPYWAFIQSVLYKNGHMPTYAELSWQIGCALAYGYKGIEYFTYWTPDPAQGNYIQALVTVDGKLTKSWHDAKRINRILQSAGKRILPLTSQSVSISALDSPPEGLPVFSPNDWIASATGSPVVIGQFATTPDAPQRTLVVTNWSHSEAATTVLTPGPGVTKAVVEDVPGQCRPRTVNGPVRLNLAPGAFALVVLDRD